MHCHCTHAISSNIYTTALLEQNMKTPYCFTIYIIIIVLATACTTPIKFSQMPTKSAIKWQGHRGCRGLLPENTIPAFIKALEFSQVNTLELDVVVSKDKQIIVSHEAWFSEHISSHPNGNPVLEKEAKSLRLYNMTYDEIKKYDVGIRGNERFPDQKMIPVYKPSFKDMVQAVETHCEINQLPLPYYDIEIKYKEHYTPSPKEFVQLMIAEIEALGIKKRVNLQSFNITVLEEIHQQDEEIIIAYLVENLQTFKKNLTYLSFKPDIYSPYFKSVTPLLVKNVHKQNMKIIPWTVNEVKDMKKMIRLGVDGVITDYPNRIEEAMQ